MSLTKVLFACALISVCAAALPCYATAIPSSTVVLSVPTKYSGRAMIATFTPPGGLTLSAYEKKLGYTQFDWTQQITNWPNADLHIFDDGTAVAPTAFSDPPTAGYSYNPCGSNSAIGGGAAPGAAAGAAPFYFNAHATVPSTNCWSVVHNETATTLSFGDEPMDPELTSTQRSTNNIPKFLTALVGICDPSNPVTGNGCANKLAGAPSSAQFAWTWQSDFNGSVGGAAVSANSPDNNQPTLPFTCDPNSGLTCGTGGVTITGICVISHGEAQPGCEGHGEGASARVPVPEPPGSLLLASGVLAILAARRVRSKKVRPRPI
jgi:hypothetical protein